MEQKNLAEYTGEKNIEVIPVNSEPFIDVVSVDEEQEPSEVFTSEENVAENLTPTFRSSSPTRFVVVPKGRSKINFTKGKRPRLAITLGRIEGDMISGLDTAQENCIKFLYDHAQESQRLEKIRRGKNTIMVRIDEMNEKNLLKLSECVKIFLRELIPMSMYLPYSLSAFGLSDILKVDSDSSFIRYVESSHELQETMRRAILEQKDLTVCCCGYVYVHPMLTFSKHPTDHTLLIGKKPGTGTLTTVKKANTIKNLNALRYYLEILYEYYTT
jgi:hypothetical protein